MCAKESERGRGSLHGAGAAKGEEKTRGEAVLGFAECKMTSNGPRSWFLSRVAVIRKISEIESLCPPSTRHSTASYLKKKKKKRVSSKHVASNRNVVRYLSEARRRKT